MTREDTVAVRLKTEIKGGVHYAAGQHRELHLEPGQEATTWANGAPILRTEFEASLEREGLFEIVEAPAQQPANPSTSARQSRLAGSGSSRQSRDEEA
jgi:hypothetical protein